MQRFIGLLTTALIATTGIATAAHGEHAARAVVERPAAAHAAAPRAEAPRYAASRAETPHYAAPRYVARPVERAPRYVARPVERAPRYVARPVERAPRYVERPVERAPRYVAHPVERAPRYVARPIVREAPREVIRERIARPHYAAPRYLAPRYVAPRYVAPRAVVRERIERRNTFVRTYAPSYFNAPVTTRRVAFRRYVPQRILVVPAVTYVYSGYTPVYTTMQTALPISWAPVTYYSDNTSYDQYNSGYGTYGTYGSDPQYASYPQYGSYPQNSYGAQYPYGNQYGAVPFGNAQLQGVVIANTNGGILVMTSSLKPVFVNTSIAQQNGYVNGNLSPGSFVNIYGYDTGSEFIATALG